MIKFFTVIFLTSFYLTANASKTSVPSIKEGPWHFEMSATYTSIPFVIEFKYKNKKLTGILENGKEQIALNDIALKGDTVTIPLQHYENSLELKLVNDQTLSGSFVRLNKNPILKTPVVGKYGVNERFTGKFKKPEQDISGEWSVKMIEDNGGKEYKGILVFEQKESKLHGSILSPTGDYRYFEGYVSGKKFEAASFDGVYNYVIKGEVDKDKIEASILANWMTLIKGEKAKKVELPDPYKQTQLEKLSFSYPDLSGKTVNLKDKKFADKPVIVTFFGSWCPNCIDEVRYLIPWFKENQTRGIEIVALSFERSLSKADALKQLKKTNKKLGINFPILLVGSTSEDKPQDKIPGLKNFISFPTTIFLNRKHEVVKVHAGFTGPSTGRFFEEWKKEFNDSVNELLK